MTKARIGGPCVTSEICGHAGVWSTKSRSDTRTTKREVHEEYHRGKILRVLRALPSSSSRLRDPNLRDPYPHPTRISPDINFGSSASRIADSMMDSRSAWCIKSYSGCTCRAAAINISFGGRASLHWLKCSRLICPSWSPCRQRSPGRTASLPASGNARTTADNLHRPP